MAKSKQEIRAEAVAVSDDANPIGWLAEGSWVTIYTADPAYHGCLVAVTPTHYHLAEASWVADTGRRHVYAQDPHNASEVEYIGTVAIERPVVSIELCKVPGALKTV